MASNECNSLRKTFDNKIMTFPLNNVRNVRSLPHEVKTDEKSRSVEKEAGCNLHVTYGTRTVHLDVSFIIYSALSMPPYFLLYVLW